MLKGNTHLIEVSELVKRYRVHKRAPGLLSALKSVVRREYDTVIAVDDLSFRIPDGERTAFLGPNGAGKTTTLKMLSGLLHPTSGTVRVGSHTPAARKRAFLRSIMFVAGQKQQLIWDLPPAETFELNRALYDIPSPQFLDTKQELVKLLDVRHAIERPARQLSLGERMKCELVAALLHRPQVLFLDEPTIGLDATMQVVIRDVINRYNQRYGATVLLTSHYMDDVEAVCQRVLVINHGRLIFDGTFESLARAQNTAKLLTLWFSKPVDDSALATFIKDSREVRFSDAVRQDGGKTVLQVPREQVGRAISLVLAQFPISDLSVADPPVEQVLAALFQRSEQATAAHA